MKIRTILTATLLAGTIIFSLQTASAQQNKKADEARQIKNMLNMIGAISENDKQKQDQIIQRMYKEKADREQRGRANYQSVDDVVNSMIQQNHQRQQQSNAYQAHQAEMAGIIVARNARKNQYSGNARQAIAGYGSNGVTAGSTGAATRGHVTNGGGTAALASYGSSGVTAGSIGSATAGRVANSGVAAGSGGGIVFKDVASIDDIGIASRASVSTPAPQTQRRTIGKVCECEGGDMKELTGIFCFDSNSEYYPARDLVAEPGFPLTSQCLYPREHIVYD